MGFLSACFKFAPLGVLYLTRPTFLYFMSFHFFGGYPTRLWRLHQIGRLFYHHLSLSLLLAVALFLDRRTWGCIQAHNMEIPCSLRDVVERSQFVLCQTPYSLYTNHLLISPYVQASSPRPNFLIVQAIILQTPVVEEEPRMAYSYPCSTRSIPLFSH